MAKKSAALEKKKESEIAKPAEGPEILGLEEFDTGDLIIPRYKIVQPTSKLGTPGLFRNNLSNEEVERLNVVVLKAAKGRVCWSENLDEDPICRSSDGLQPSDNVETPINSICGRKENGRRFEPVCDNATWGEKSERPLCDEVINLLCIGKDDKVPFFISLHGKQLRPCRAFLSAIGLRKKSLYEYQTTLTLKEVSNTKGKFFVIQFEELKENTDEEKETFRSLYFQYVSQSIDLTFEIEKKMQEAEQEGVPA
jgi:hypothetical protein